MARLIIAFLLFFPAVLMADVSVRIGAGVHSAPFEAVGAPTPPCVDMCDVTAYLPEKDSDALSLGLRVMHPVSDRFSIGLDVSATELILSGAVAVEYRLTDRFSVDLGAGYAQTVFDSVWVNRHDYVPAVSAGLRYRIADGVSLFAQHTVTDKAEYDQTGTYVIEYDPVTFAPVYGSYPIHATNEIRTTLLGVQFDI